MKKEYQKPTSEILEIEPLQMICTSPGTGEDTPPEDEEWFFTEEANTPPKYTGELD
ncbi:MAG: hypothetical protein J6B91_05435 [Prevotella sp.]|nr:hypothetical protein [Prevotella sp.]